MELDIFTLFSGADIPVPEISAAIHQPTLMEIGFVGEKRFLSGAQCFLINKNMLLSNPEIPKEALGQIDNFSLFLDVLQQKEIKEQVETFLYLIFPKCTQIIFTPRALLLKQDAENIMIDEGNFEVLQDIIRKIFRLDLAGADDFNPSNEEAAKIAAKLKRGRERVAAQKRAENGGEGSLFSTYLSSMAVALHMPLGELMKLTIFQINDLVERYQLWYASDLDVRVRLAGGKPDSQPENWMKNIH